jgi:hypothetical protein
MRVKLMAGRKWDDAHSKVNLPLNLNPFNQEGG